MRSTIANIQSEKRRGNLFINIFGALNRKSTAELKDSINIFYNGSGNVFFNVEKMEMQQERQIYRRILSNILADCCLPPDKFFLIGQEGVTISPDGCRVIVRPKKKCCGKCKNCNC